MVSVRYVVWRGGIWRVDALLGFYERLIAVPPERLEPSPGDPIYPARVHRYAQMYRAGSPFPPITVAGPRFPGDTYGICNGHHRWSAACLVGAPTIPAWTSFQVKGIGGNGQPYWTTARVSETETGRILADLAGLEYCPCCGTIQNYRAGDEACPRCRLVA